MAELETVGDMLARRGMSRRALLKYSAYLASLMALPPASASAMADSLGKAKRTSVIWLSFQECTACSEALTRAYSPTIDQLIFDFISLDYIEVLQAASGHQAEAAKEAAMEANKGEYLVLVDGSIPTGNMGFSTVAGHSNIETLKHCAEHAKAVISIGTCAAFGGLPAALPNPTGAVSVEDIITDKPVVNVPGCPPIPEAMTGVLAHVLTFGTLPELDDRKRPLAFFGNSIHDRCYRRSFYDKGLFAKSFDDEGARKGWCLYELGCKGPVAYNACSTLLWNGGTSWPVKSGHGCFACASPGFWDSGSIYTPLPAATAGLNGPLAAGAAAGAAAALYAAREAGKRRKDLGAKMFTDADMGGAGETAKRTQWPPLERPSKQESSQ